MKVSSKVSIVNKKSFNDRIKKVNSMNGKTVWECMENVGCKYCDCLEFVEKKDEE